MVAARQSQCREDIREEWRLWQSAEYTSQGVKEGVGKALGGVWPRISKAKREIPTSNHLIFKCW